MRLLASATFVLATAVPSLPAPAQVDWSQLHLLPNREHHAMAFDDARGCLVVFGGYNAAGGLGDTWEYDGTRWSERATTSTRPAARWGAALVHDAARSRCVLFGGLRIDGAVLDETWEWDGTSWLRRRPATAPPPRRNHAATYDAARQRVVVHGGTDGTLFLDDTWEWDGATWTRTALSSSPGPRQLHAMAYDAARQRTVLFGGYTPTSFPGAGDTWEWDGVAWTQRFPATQPYPRLSHAMAYDALHARVVMYGGAYADDDMWTWDGNDWTLVPSASATDPGGRLRHALAWDSAHQRILLFGGWATVHVNGTTCDLWQWDGQAWTLLYEGVPPERNGSAIAYDPVRDRAVLKPRGPRAAPQGVRRRGRRPGSLPNQLSECDAATSGLAEPLPRLCAAVASAGCGAGIAAGTRTASRVMNPATGCPDTSRQRMRSPSPP